MASGLSIYYADKVNDFLWRGTSFTPPASTWVALFMNVGSSAFLRTNTLGSANEMSGDTYARVKIMATTSILFAVSASGHTDNTADIAFAAAGTSWGTVYAAALMDASTAGNVVAWADVTPILVTPPDVVTIAAGYFDFNL